MTSFIWRSLYYWTNAFAFVLLITLVSFKHRLFSRIPSS